MAMKVYLDTNILKASIDSVLRMFPQKQILHLDDGKTITFDQCDIRKVNPNEKAIRNLKKAKVLTPKKMHDLSQDELAKLIKPAGYFNIKAKRPKHFLNYLFDEYDGRLDRLLKNGLIF